MSKKNSLQDVYNWMGTRDARSMFKGQYYLSARVAVRSAYKVFGNCALSEVPARRDWLEAQYLQQGLAAATAKSYASMLLTVVRKYEDLQNKPARGSFELGGGRAISYTLPKNLKVEEVTRFYYHLMTRAEDFLADPPKEIPLHVPVIELPEA